MSAHDFVEVSASLTLILTPGLITLVLGSGPNNRLLSESHFDHACSAQAVTSTPSAPHGLAQQFRHQLPHRWR